MALGGGRQPDRLGFGGARQRAPAGRSGGLSDARRPEADHACLHGFANATPCTGHWNETGHAVTGAAIAETLCRDVLAPATPRQPQSQPAG